jgi:hypothetical protein
MSETQSPVINVETSDAKKPFGLSVDQWIKVIAFIMIVLIIGSIVHSFNSAKNSSAFKNLSDAFGNATGALAWASSHWYLFFAAVILSPFVTPAGKWASERLSNAKKAGLDEKTLDKVSDAIVYTEKKSEANQADPEAREELEKAAEKAKENFQADDTESQDAADQYAEKNPGQGIDVIGAAKTKPVTSYHTTKSNVQHSTPSTIRMPYVQFKQAC